MYIYIHTHVYIHTCVYTCIYIFIYTCIYIYTHMYAYLHVGIRACVSAHALFMYARLCIYTLYAYVHKLSAGICNVRTQMKD